MPIGLAERLDHVNIEIQFRSGATASRLLCAFTPPGARRDIVADYSYLAFREWLMLEYGVPPTDQLCVRGTKDWPPITDEQTFWLTLIAIKRGTLRLELQPRWQVPLLSLSWDKDTTPEDDSGSYPEPLSESRLSEFHDWISPAN